MMAHEPPEARPALWARWERKIWPELMRSSFESSPLDCWNTLFSVMALGLLRMYRGAEYISLNRKTCFLVLGRTNAWESECSGDVFRFAFLIPSESET